MQIYAETIVRIIIVESGEKKKKKMKKMVPMGFETMINWVLKPML